MELYPAIQTENMSKTYRLYAKPSKRLLERLPWVTKPLHRPIHALANISIEVPAGTCVGLIGGNGAGKSTLLKILTRTSFPTSGSYTIRGRVAALLELGAGFHQDFSGRDNIFMNAALMGLSRKETQRRYDEIVEFSELGDFIHAPIRTYSSGMVCRLGFSVAVATDPDVLIIDEILAVGDMHFQRKCVERIMEFKKRGKTMFFCSHSLYDVRQICDRAIWLKQGRLEMFGDAVTVTNEYATYENQIIAAQEVAPWHQGEAPIEVKPKQSDDHARILSAYLVDASTGERRNEFQPGDCVGVRVHIRNGCSYEPLALATGFTRADGTLCFAHTTEIDGVTVDFMEGVVTLVLPQLKLLSGEFVVPVWLLDARGVHRFHEQPCAENLIVKNRNKEIGLFYAEREWKVEVIEPAPAKERSP